MLILMQNVICHYLKLHFARELRNFLFKKNGVKYMKKKNCLKLSFICHSLFKFNLHEKIELMPQNVKYLIA